MKFKYIIIFILPFLLFNCEESLEEFNIDPTRPTAVGLNLSLPEVISSAVFNEGGEPARAAGIVMQQYEGFDAQQLGFTSYLFLENTFNNYWRTGLYAGALKSCQVVIDNADAEGNPIYSGIAKVVMAHQYNLGTTYFGDMPMSQALQGPDILQPAYDDQQTIYTATLAMLDDAIADLGQEGNYIGGDLIYDGDASLWIKTAHSIKARIYLQLSKRDASNYANALASAALGYASAEEESALTFDESTTGSWSIASFARDRAGTMIVDNNFVSLMENDPRRDIVITGNAIDGFWTQNNATVPLISYTELKFIEAEAMSNMGSGAAANDAFEAAITSNFVRYGLDADTLAGYLATVGPIAGDGSAGDVDAIITEAYKAYFGYNFHETWSNWRRTGVPALVSRGAGDNGANPSNTIPVRFLYASSERTTNSVNLEAAIAAQNGALLDAPLWVFE